MAFVCPLCRWPRLQRPAHLSCQTAWQRLMLLLTSVQMAKAAEALAAKTEELAAKAAEMETLQRRFDEEHAELEELQAGDCATMVGGRKFGLLVLQAKSQQGQQAVASAASVDTCASCIPPC